MAAPGVEARALFAEGVRAVLGGWAALQVRGTPGTPGDTLGGHWGQLRAVLEGSAA